LHAAVDLQGFSQAHRPGSKETVMRRNMVVAVIIFLLAILASSVAWAHGSRHGHGFTHQGLGHHGHRGHGRGHGHFHSRGRVEIIIGAPLPGSWHYRGGSPYYYGQHHVYTYPPVIAAPSAPPVYIERGAAGGLEDSLQQPRAYWYYCSNPQGYYPYVSNCPLGWQQVPAQPPPDLK
jgi:hypothetical protein